MTNNPLLSHTRVTSAPSPGRWLYIIHGIYGSGRNWAGFAKRLVERRPEWGVILPDLRLHGGSKGFPPPDTVSACAADLAGLEEDLGLPACVLLGHSFGGKVALVSADRGNASLKQVWVVDSTLQAGKPSGSAWEVIQIVRTLPDTFDARQKIEEVLVSHGYEQGVGTWLAMNLERDDGKFRWKLDWDRVEEMLRDYFATDVWKTVENPPAGMEIHVVKAEESSAIDPEAVERINRASERTGKVHLHRVASGHWINVDSPEALLALLNQHLP
jgi:pimeloyl-ACP methyl ester carboxylesterase